jgi:hypothetical protein
LQQQHLMAAPVGIAAAEALQRVQEHGLSGAVDTAGQIFRGMLQYYTTISYNVLLNSRISA